jgi:hypothetical protein
LLNTWYVRGDRRKIEYITLNIFLHHLRRPPYLLYTCMRACTFCPVFIALVCLSTTAETPSMCWYLLFRRNDVSPSAWYFHRDFYFTSLSVARELYEWFTTVGALKKTYWNPIRYIIFKINSCLAIKICVYSI